jgi:hypothetical protein
MFDYDGSGGRQEEIDAMELREQVTFLQGLLVEYEKIARENKVR